MPELLIVQEVLLEDNTGTEATCDPLTRRTPVAEDVVWLGAILVCGIFESPPCLEVEMATSLPADLRILVLDMLALLCLLC